MHSISALGMGPSVGRAASGCVITRLYNSVRRAPSAPMPRCISRVALALVSALVLASPALAGRFEDRSLQGHRYRVFVPANYRAGQPTPLVVLLHGCTQDPQVFARATRIADAAERRGWLVLLPEQPSGANQNRCWNWFLPEHQGRGAGEPAWIAAAVEAAAREYTVDRARVYAAGLSAGAAMAVILGVTHPDLFAAIGVGAGLEYRAATSMVEAFAAMRSGGPAPATQARVAKDAMGPRARAVPAIVIHGAADTTVAPVNAAQVAAMWAELAGLVEPAAAPLTAPPRRETSPGGLAYDVVDRVDPAGRVLVRSVLVAGMGHAWSGGSRDGTFVDPAGPDATELCLEFFALHALSASPPPPAPPVAPTPVVPAPVVPAPVASAGLALASIPAEDGWAGRFVAHGASDAEPMLGDAGMFDPDRYRALLSFDGRGLGRPARVKLRVQRAALSGRIDAIAVDLKLGAFGKLAGPEVADHRDPATHAEVVRLTVPASDGGWAEVELPAQAVALLTGSARVQLRLRAIGPASFRENQLRIGAAELVADGP